MNTRQLTILFLPSLLFAGFSIILICAYFKCKNISEDTALNHAAFVKFIADVREGKRPMNTQLWIDQITLHEEEAQSFRQSIWHGANALGEMGALGLVLSFIQVAAVVSMRTNLRVK